jgi:ATP-binding cassette subfamily C protein CydD
MSIHKRLLQYGGKTMYLYVIVVGMLGFFTASCIIMQAHFIAQIMNGAFLLRQSLTSLQAPLITLLLVLLMRAALVWSREAATNAVACRVKSELRSRLYSHLFMLGPLYMRGERSGEIVHTLADGVEALDAYFVQFFPQVVATMLIPAVILIAVFKIDLLSGTVLLLTWPILPVFMILIGLQANAMTKKRWQVLSQLSAHFLDVLQGLTTLKLFGRAEVQEQMMRKVSERYGAITMKVLRVAFLSSFVMEMGATLSTAIVAVEIGLRLLYATIPFESAFFILLLAPEFYLPLRSLGTGFHASMESVASAERIFDMLETPTSEVAGSGTATCAEMALHRSLAFHDVHYSYPTPDGNETCMEALKGVSFAIRPGQTVAFVGASGAGKTTIASLLLRFMEPTQGEITVDDRPIQQFAAQEWRKFVAWQPQNPSVYNTTVAENIRLGYPDAPMEEVVKAAQVADIDDFIQTLPLGYETVIGERGARLSGGQVQRLSLARAFLKHAPVLLVDEATSTLDSESEARVFHAIKQVMNDRMVLVIAHHLNTIKDADQIVVLQEGRIVACGTHEDLRQRSPVYQQLVQAYDGQEVGA